VGRERCLDEEQENKIQLVKEAVGYYLLFLRIVMDSCRAE